MVLRCLFLWLFLLAGVWASPVAAHKDHEKQKAEQLAAQNHPQPVNHKMTPAVHEAVKDDLARLENESARPWHVRLLDWAGRIHPFAVHFPLALFPVAWIALMLGRRRGETEALLRSIIMVAGASAAIAAAVGWINGGFSMVDADPILLWHRWVGTGLGLAGVAIAVWSWRYRSAAHSRTMVWLLGTLTALLLVQGWLGGALIHGIDHMNW